MSFWDGFNPRAENFQPRFTNDHPTLVQGRTNQERVLSMSLFQTFVLLLMQVLHCENLGE